MQAAASGDTETVCHLVTRVNKFDKQFSQQSRLLDVRNEFGYSMLHYSVVYTSTYQW